MKINNFIKPVIEQDHYFMGTSPLDNATLMKDGHGWGDYMPAVEDQYKNGLETNCCPAYGTLNAVEAIGKKKYGAYFQSNLSERYLSILSGMDGHGGNPHAIAEVLRKFAGAIPEVFLPFDSKITTLKDYFSPRVMPYNLFKYGYSWLKKYVFGHEWVFVDGSIEHKKILMKEALRTSPLGVAGFAWSMHSDGKYYSDGPAIHWFVVFDYVEGDHWLVYDSYAPYVKKLAWDYDFSYCKRYTLNRNITGENSMPVTGEAFIPYVKYVLKTLFGLK